MGLLARLLTGRRVEGLGPLVFGDLVPGLRVTFHFETCSSFAPYDRIAAGASYVIVGLLDHPSENPYFLLADSVADYHAHRQALAVPLLELQEASDLDDQLRTLGYRAAARGAAPSR